MDRTMSRVHVGIFFAAAIGVLLVQPRANAQNSTGGLQLIPEPPAVASGTGFVDKAKVAEDDAEIAKDREALAEARKTGDHAKITAARKKLQTAIFKRQKDSGEHLTHHKGSSLQWKQKPNAPHHHPKTTAPAKELIVPSAPVSIGTTEFRPVSVGTTGTP